MSRSDQDRYFVEFAVIARALGADPVPTTRREAGAIIATYRPALLADQRTRAVADKVLNQPAPSSLVAPMQGLVMRAAVDLLQPWARKMHRLPSSGLATPLIRGATIGIAETLRWAFVE